MMRFRQVGAMWAVAVACLPVWPGAAVVQAQQTDASSVIRSVDAAVKARRDGIVGYTVNEHYAVYRGKDETHPAAEMTVRTDYRKDSGKSYTIIAESGSEFIRNHVLRTLLEDEKRINLPGIREASWLTSANYQMQLTSGAPRQVDGRECFAVAISPRRKATNMIEGTLWADAADGSIVRLEGTATQSPSIFTGAAQVMRQYVEVNGFAMATQARAVSDSFLLGRTTVTVDYRNYQIELASAH
jgi:hypothetical protein